MKSIDEQRRTAYTTTLYSKNEVDRVFDAFGGQGLNVLEHCTAWCVPPIDYIPILKWFDKHYIQSIDDILYLLNDAIISTPMTVGDIFNACFEIHNDQKNDLRVDLYRLWELSRCGEGKSAGVMAKKIKQLSGDLNTKVVFSHKQRRLINHLYESLHPEIATGSTIFNPPFDTEPKVEIHEVKCGFTNSCRNRPYHCYLCNRNQSPTRSPDCFMDWYSPAFKTGGVVTSNPGEMISSIDFSPLGGNIYYGLFHNPKPGMKTVKGCEYYLHCDHKGCLNCFDNPTLKVTLDGSMGFNFKPVSAAEMGKTIRNIINKINMNIKLDLKAMQVEADGKKYKITEIEKELTLEDCIKDNRFYMKLSGWATISGNLMPTEAIAYKVLLYGLLQSVAYKLNCGDLRNRGYAIMPNRDKGVDDYVHGYFEICLVTGDSIYPLFRTEELANKAIRIFENSKFDLKKLFQ
jgi:hypothetical protein